MSGDITPYTSLITSEHASCPNYVATVAFSVQPFADALVTILGMPAAFDLDNAAGAQLDAVGTRVGASRALEAPLEGVYFSWDTTGLGWDEGAWQGPFDPSSGLVSLPDDNFRILIRATIFANQWDGTAPGAYAAYEILFGSGLGNLTFTQLETESGLGLETENGDTLGFDNQSAVTVLIQDNGDMTMYLALVSNTPDSITTALLKQGVLSLVPAGVTETIFQQSVAGSPYFGFDVENTSISGWDTGGWAVPL